MKINLIALCRQCHDLAHQGKEITTNDLRTQVAGREGCYQQEIIDVVNLLLRLPKRAREDELQRELRCLNYGARALFDRTWEEIGGRA